MQLEWKTPDKTRLHCSIYTWLTVTLAFVHQTYAWLHERSLGLGFRVSIILDSKPKLLILYPKP